MGLIGIQPGQSIQEQLQIGDPLQDGGVLVRSAVEGEGDVPLCKGGRGCQGIIYPGHQVGLKGIGAAGGRFLQQEPELLERLASGDREVLQTAMRRPGRQ